MGYSKEVYTEAKVFLDNLRNKNIKDYEQRRKKFREKCLRGAVIEDKIASTSIFIARSVLSGKNVREELAKLKEEIDGLKKELTLILKKANLPKDYLEIKYNCKICLDAGYVGGIMCDCFKKILRNVTYNRLSRLSPLTLCNFSTFNLDYYNGTGVSPSSVANKSTKEREKMQKIYNFCMDYANNFCIGSVNIFMIGETGLGKTHLSLAIANKVIEKGFGVVYASVPNITSKLEKERFRYLSEENTEKHLSECDLLILDDLGTEYHTPFSNSIMYNIINNRLLLGRSTIISTNCSLKMLESDYSKRLISRIWGNYKLLRFCGSDIRAQKAIYKASLEKMIV